MESLADKKTHIKFLHKVDYDEGTPYIWVCSSVLDFDRGHLANGEMQKENTQILSDIIYTMP